MSASSASCPSKRVAAKVVYSVDLHLKANFIAKGVFGLVRRLMLSVHPVLVAL